MKNISENITPDSFSGLIFGLEGLKGGAVILNGPTGCKFYHSAAVDGATLKSLSFDPMEYPEKFYFGQARVPCTFLDSHDYVYGSKEKLIELLEEVKERKHDFIALINSPGAALIGDDLKGILDQVAPSPIYFSIDSPGFSESYGEGLQKGIMALIDNVKVENTKKKVGSVNLLGMHLFQKHALGNLKEIKALLELGGVKVNTAFFEDNLNDLEKLGQSELNIVLCPECGLKVAEKLKDEFGIDYFVPSQGQPIGFDATESFFRELSERILINIEPIFEEIYKMRARAYIFLARYTSVLGIPKGATYRINAEASMVLPLVQLLTQYLGMIPLEVKIKDDSYRIHIDKLREILEPFCEIGENNSGKFAQMVVGDGNEVASSTMERDYLFGIEVEEPSMGYADIVEKTLYGGKGTLYILEQVINGLKFS